MNRFFFDLGLPAGFSIAGMVMMLCASPFYAVSDVEFQAFGFRLFLIAAIALIVTFVLKLKGGPS